MIGKQNEKSKDGAKVRQSAFLAGALLQIWGITKAALRWGCGGGVGSSMAWGYPPALWLSLVGGRLCDVLWSGDVLRAWDTWQERGFLLLLGKRRSTVWGCLGMLGWSTGKGLAVPGVVWFDSLHGIQADLILGLRLLSVLPSRYWGTGKKRE